MIASMSSASIRSSSPEPLSDESEPSILILPSEPDTFTRSEVPMDDHKEFPLPLGEPVPPARCEPFLLPGIFIALPANVGEASGEEGSARVEWWRFVAALEKSKPRDRLGKILAGDPYVSEGSSLGDRGFGDRGLRLAAGGNSRGGI